jgi:hypothetical protein
MLQLDQEFTTAEMGIGAIALQQFQAAQVRTGATTRPEQSHKFSFNHPIGPQ